MADNPPVMDWGNAVQKWADQWRGAAPAAVTEAAVTEGIALCDAIVNWATPLLANAAVRPPRPMHLRVLQAILNTWSSGASRLRRQLPADRVPPELLVAVDRARVTIRALVVAEASIRAALPPEPPRTSTTQEELRDAIRARRAMGG